MNDDGAQVLERVLDDLNSALLSQSAGDLFLAITSVTDVTDANAKKAVDMIMAMFNGPAVTNPLSQDQLTTIRTARDLLVTFYNTVLPKDIANLIGWIEIYCGMTPSTQPEQTQMKDPTSNINYFVMTTSVEAKQCSNPQAVTLINAACSILDNLPAPTLTGRLLNAYQNLQQAASLLTPGMQLTQSKKAVKHQKKAA